MRPGVWIEGFVLGPHVVLDGGTWRIDVAAAVWDREGSILLAMSRNLERWKLLQAAVYPQAMIPSKE
jgi:hypothetical protein